MRIGETCRIWNHYSDALCVTDDAPLHACAIDYLKSAATILAEASGQWPGRSYNTTVWNSGYLVRLPGSCMAMGHAVWHYMVPLHWSEPPGNTQHICLKLGYYCPSRSGKRTTGPPRLCLPHPVYAYFDLQLSTYSCTSVESPLSLSCTVWFNLYLALWTINCSYMPASYIWYNTSSANLVSNDISPGTTSKCH